MVKVNNDDMFMRQIESKAMAYRFDCGRGPADLQELYENSNDDNCWRGPYLDEEQLFRAAQILRIEGGEIKFNDGYPRLSKSDYLAPSSLFFVLCFFLVFIACTVAVFRRRSR